MVEVLVLEVKTTKLDTTSMGDLIIADDEAYIYVHVLLLLHKGTQ